MNENLANEIRKTIESVKDMKIQASGINNYLSILEGLIRADCQKQVDEAYQRGLDEAWDAAKKVVLNSDEGGLDVQELNEVFNCATIQQVFRRYTLSEVIAKLKAYEEKRKADEDVKRGDVVRHKINGLTYIVTLANECGYVLLDSDGNFTTSCITNSFEKTGRHFDIDKILEEAAK